MAQQLNVPQNRISQIIAGKRSITGDTALRLGHRLRPLQKSGLTCSSAYELRLAE
ncbi:transcriptional regulator [Rhizobium johnstonii]|uniref:helix-turn-helix transcriptional regulator n=1 Tax=Rhizobium johnstonii TaxID=3019933 RepID=UPI003F98F90C